MVFIVGDQYEINHGLSMVITITKVSKCFVWFIYTNGMNELELFKKKIVYDNLLNWSFTWYEDVRIISRQI